MEVRDPIHGNIDIDPAERLVIDHPFFQRLRNIKATGFADLAYPGSTHSRYAHSIGTMALAGRAFDSVFRDFQFKHDHSRVLFRRVVRLAALLHDVGHAPFSHVTEFAMPMLAELHVPCMVDRPDRRATHEDYTVKIITDSSLTPLLHHIGGEELPGLVAALVDVDLPCPAGAFVDDGVDYHPVLAQLVSSELDVDRMDYLRRDSYNSGVGYGHFDADWLIVNLTFHVTEEGRAHLALDPRALYAFEDFLIARYHMFLQVYFHHKSVIYEEMLRHYFQECPGEYVIPADIELYLSVDDFDLFSALRTSPNTWARRIVTRDAWKLLVERHEGGVKSEGLEQDRQALESGGIPIISASSRGDLSKYTKPGAKRRRGPRIFARRKHPGGSPFHWPEARPLDECTELFTHYEAERQIRRIYVQREDLARARSLLGLQV